MRMRTGIAAMLLLWTGAAPAELMEFANRAACAQDSRRPALGAYVMIDAYTAGKWLDSYRQAAGVGAGSDGDALIEEGLDRFRQEFTRRMMGVAEALLSGGTLSLSGTPGRSGLISCRRILRFSSLDTEGGGGVPDRAGLGRIAEDQSRRSGIERDCFEAVPAGSSRRYLLRLEVEPSRVRDWDAVGFDFWHSLRARLFQDWAQEGPFRDLALDQMVVFLPRGCRSLERPDCTRDQIALQELRGLLHASGNAAALKKLYRSPESALLADPSGPKQAPRWFPEEGDAEAWLKEIQTHLARTRGIMKLRLLSAVSTLGRIGAALGAGGVHPGLVALRNLPGTRQKLRILCSEGIFALDPAFGKFRNRFHRLRDRPALHEWASSLGELSLPESLDSSLRIGEEVLRFCEESRVQGYWKDAPLPENSAYADWYRISALQEDLPGLGPQSMGSLFNQGGFVSRATLWQERITPEGELEAEVVCADVSDCSRAILRAFVDLLVVLDWADSLIRVREVALAPGWMNPWSAATACGAYDPGASMRRAWGTLVGELVSSVLSGVTPVPVWVSVHRNVGRIIGWTESEGGHLSPVRSGRRLEYALGLDFGPLTGIPCAAVVGARAPELGLPAVYRLTGVRAQACSRSENHRVVLGAGTDAEEVAPPSPARRATCLVCVISPVAGPAAPGLLNPAPGWTPPPLRLMLGLLASALHFSRNMRDPDDVPRRAFVDPARVQEAHARHRTLPDRCVKRLLRGKGCR
jgi:hypothetical protein